MQKQTKNSVKALSYCAMLTALSVVFARLMGLMPNESMRFSIEAVPIFLAGMLFGPVLGGCVGFAADFIGCLFSPFGYNPIFCIPPILYGVAAGLLRPMLRKQVSILRLTIAFLLPVVIGSLLYQSATLAYMYYKDGPFLQGFLYYLTTRSVQFAITLVADVTVIYLLLKSKLLDRIGLWNSGKDEK
jgi:ECF transporter S component (folate family)